MRILVVGGTRFVGRHLAAAALDRGHQVTLFHRGRSGPKLFPEATHLLGDRDSDLSALQTGAWHATIDPSAYVPRQVRGLADGLAGRGGRYVYISSTAVYATPTRPWSTEDALLAEREVAGTFHAVSPPPPFGFGDLLEEVVAAVGPPQTTLTWVERSFLLAAGLDDATLPMWPGADPESNYEAADPGRAATAGLAPRPLGQTIHETLEHELAQPTPTRPGVGLPAALERDLLASWHARSDPSQA